MHSTVRKIRYMTYGCLIMSWRSHIHSRSQQINILTSRCSQRDYIPQTAEKTLQAVISNKKTRNGNLSVRSFNTKGVRCTLFDSNAHHARFSFKRKKRESERTSRVLEHFLKCALLSPCLMFLLKIVFYFKRWNVAHHTNSLIAQAPSALHI